MIIIIIIIMSSLKVIKGRMRSVGNTKKISQTMKLVSAAKYSRAEKELIQARKFGNCPKLFFDSVQVIPDENPNSQLFLAMTSDRGLCGAIHSGLSRIIGTTINKLTDDQKKFIKLICIGEKNCTILSRIFADKIIWVASDIGKKPFNFIDAEIIAGVIMETMKQQSFSRTRIYYNKLVFKLILIFFKLFRILFCNFSG